MGKKKKGRGKAGKGRNHNKIAQPSVSHGHAGITWATVGSVVLTLGQSVVPMNDTARVLVWIAIIGLPVWQIWRDAWSIKLKTLMTVVVPVGGIMVALVTWPALLSVGPTDFPLRAGSRTVITLTNHTDETLYELWMKITVDGKHSSEGIVVVPSGDTSKLLRAYSQQGGTMLVDTRMACVDINSRHGEWVRIYQMNPHESRSIAVLSAKNLMTTAHVELVGKPLKEPLEIIEGQKEIHLEFKPPEAVFCTPVGGPTPLGTTSSQLGPRFAPQP